MTTTQELSKARLADVRLWRGLQTELRLSDRQVQVAILIVQGLTIRQIGERLGVSRFTANTHYRRLKARAASPDKAALVLALLHRSGILLG